MLVDFSGSFHQIPVHPETVPLMAVAMPARVFECLRMPWPRVNHLVGLSTSSKREAKGPENVKRIWTTLTILMPRSPSMWVTFSRHPDALVEAQHKILAIEGVVGITHSALFGHTNTPDGIHPNADEVAALTAMPLPETMKQLCSLMGRLSYYVSFLENVSKRMKPTTTLPKKGARFNFNSVMEKRYEQC